MTSPLGWHDVDTRWHRYKWLYVTKRGQVLSGAQSLPAIERESERYGGGEFGGWIQLTPKPLRDSPPPA